MKVAEPPPHRLCRHPGPATSERITWRLGSCMPPHRMLIQPGADVYRSLERWISTSPYDGAAFRLIHGVVRELDLMTGKPDSDSNRVATFHGPHHIECPATVLGGHGAVGRGAGNYALHTHAIFLDKMGIARGCHLIRGRCIAGDGGVSLGVFPLVGAGFQLGYDEETTFDLFYPRAMTGMSAPSETVPTTRALLVKLQPNQDIYAGLETACRMAGLRSGLVVSGVGSVNDAWILRNTHDTAPLQLIEGPGLEVAGVTGTIEVETTRTSVLTGWIARADGSVTGGVLARDRNIVCITFEFTVMEWTPDASCEDIAVL